MPYCNKCGSEVSDTAKFCVKCGTETTNYTGKVGQEETVPPQRAASIFAVLQTLEGVDKKLLNSPKIGYLANALEEGEVPEFVVSMLGNECLVATDRRIVHVQSPLFGGFKSESFHYSNVLSIEQVKMFRGQLTVHNSDSKTKSIAGIDRSRSQAFADFVNNKLRPTAYGSSHTLPARTAYDVPAQPGEPEGSETTVQQSSPAPFQTEPKNSKADAINAALRRIDGFERFLTRGEIRELPAILWEDEIPLMLTEGLYHKGRGLLVATDRRLVFIDKGMFGSLKVEDFGYDRITSVESQTGLFSGTIVIYASGNSEEISSVSNVDVTAMSGFLRNRIYNPKAATSSSNSSAGTVSAAEELAKFSALLNQGVITQEEFDAQKSRLLGLLSTASNIIYSEAI